MCSVIRLPRKAHYFPPYAAARMGAHLSCADENALRAHPLAPIYLDLVMNVNQEKL